MFLKYISIPVFIISLAIGIFFVYIYGSDIKPIYIYPTPENKDMIQYKDYAENCFTYEPIEVKCGNNFNVIPIQNKIN